MDHDDCETSRTDQQVKETTELAEVPRRDSERKRGSRDVKKNKQMCAMQCVLQWEREQRGAKMHSAPRQDNRYSE